VADNTPFDAQPAQLASHPARIGERLEADVGIERRIEVIKRLVTAIGQEELAASVFRRRCVEQRSRRRPQQVRGSD